MADSSGGEPGRRGMGDSLRSLATGAIGLVATHIELIGVELREEKQRMAELLVLGACAVVLFAMALLLATLLVVVWLWDSHRLEAIIGLTLLYSALGGAAVYVILDKLGHHPNPFAATAAELEKDRERLHP